jgi:hypothetical protein
MKTPVLAIFLLVLHAQGVRADGVSAADDAFAAGLWEVAALRYEARLADTEMPAAERQRTAIRLAESLVRQGDPAKAMVLLEQSWLEPSPERDFWLAQALAGSGRFADAVRDFRELLETGRATYPEETAFTCANLQLSLGLPEDALATLEAIRSPAADLRRAAICLDLGRHEQARALLPVDEVLTPDGKPFAALLGARLLLAEDKPEAAAAAFKALIDSPTGQSRSNHHAAVIGYADAQAAMGVPDAASASLVSFIQAQPDSPLLDAMFKRLHEWLPESPAASDPVLERLAQWIPPAQVPVTGLVAAKESSVGAWPQASSVADLTTFALFTRGVGLHRVDDPASKHEARQLLKRLLLENPGHFLAGRALLEIGRWHLQDGRIGPAMHLFSVVRENAKAPRLRGESAFLEARAAYDEGRVAEAAVLFDEAAADLDAQAASAALFNAAVVRLGSGETGLIQQAGDTTEDRSLIADLKLERALVLSSPEERRAAIEEFLINHPAHPRVPEARLAAAEAALLSSPPDASFARAQLDTLDAMRGDGPPPSARALLARLRIADLTNDSPEVIAIAGGLLENHAEDPAAAEAALTLGRHLFQSGSYNDARLVFEKLAGNDTDANRAQAAWLLAARAAALGATTQSREEALGRFDKAIEIDGPVREIARLEKARLMIDLNRLPEAVDFLRGWITAMPEEDVLRLPAGLLLGEAVYAQGAANPEALEEALAIYDGMLDHSREQPTLLHRLQYLRGMTLEQLPRKDDPSRKREAEALDAYFSVFDAAAADPPPAEWEWFERCGFRALGILENAQRWEAAIAVAQKIASFKGPRAEEAATRASQLQLKHMIWED